MRVPFHLLGVSYAALLLLCPETALRAQAPAHAPLLPIPPAEILTFLPAAPPEWKVTQSHASNQFMDWLTTESLREYHRPPPPPGRNSDGSTAPDLITRVRVIDTGYWPALAGEFAPGADGRGGLDGISTVAGFPAVRAALGKDRERLRLFVKRRFLVQIDVFNQPADSVLAWTRLIDLQKLAGVPDAGSDKLPKPIMLTVIDELDPKKNSVSRLQWMSDAEMEAASRQTPAASR